LSEIPTLAPEEQKALADIYQTQALFDQAIESLTIYLSKARLIPFVIENEKLILPKDYNSLGYPDRMSFISLADTYAGLGQFITGFSILDQVEKYSGQSTPSFEPLVLGICRQARAEYLSQQNKFDLALIEILKAENFFIHDDQSLDYVFFIKWKAYILSQVGGAENIELSKKLFKRGRGLLNRKGVRPEVLVDYIRLETVAKQADGRLNRGPSSVSKINKKAPLETELLKLSWYPGLTEDYRKRSFRNSFKALILNAKKVEYRVFLASREWHNVSGDERSANLPLELELAGWVKVCGEVGLPVYRSFELLWPSEVNSFFELENRLKALVQRCRQKYGLQLKIKDRTLYLLKSDSLEVHLKNNSVPGFLEHRKVFQSTELDRYYNLKSRSQRAQLISDWKEKKWIEKIPSSQKKGYSYRVLVRES
jgi:hypothetical protein